MSEATPELTSDEREGTFVILPAFNEERILQEVVEGVLALGVHVVVVDDGSTDRTAERLREFPVQSQRSPG